MAQTTDFDAETRLVLVDVVASDESDQPILGLKPDDFKVLEDGKPQQIRFFDPHTAATQEKATQVPRELPPHVYTNVPEEDPAVVRTIVLFDTLNTPTSDQAYARREMVKFLKVLPKGQSIALFTLGRQLRMVHGFTGKADELLAAAEKIFPEHSPLVTTDTERQTNLDELVKIENASAVSQGPPAIATASASAFASSAAQSAATVTGYTDRLRQFMAENEASYDDMRIRLTV